MYGNLEYAVTNSYFANNRQISYLESSVSSPVMYVGIKEIVRETYSRKADYEIVINSSNEVESFLKSTRPIQPFIGQVNEISHYITECFSKVTCSTFPDNISIRICSPTELREIHSNFSDKWSSGIQGFSINGPVKEIFVKQDQFDKIMITLGHEIGHVISPQLSSMQMEEAKAFAFEIAWVNTLREHNIGGLKDCINDMLPAQNGVHDVGFSFVIRKLREGISALELFLNLSRGHMNECF